MWRLSTGQQSSLQTSQILAGYLLLFPASSLVCLDIKTRGLLPPLSSTKEKGQQQTRLGELFSSVCCVKTRPGILKDCQTCKRSCGYFLCFLAITLRPGRQATLFSRQQNNCALKRKPIDQGPNIYPHFDYDFDFLLFVFPFRFDLIGCVII